MSKSPLHAFFVGRAIAEGVYEQLENVVTNSLSTLGKFDAEQRENLRSFIEQALERADREAQAENNVSSSSNLNYQPKDLQAIIDDLRAEVAQVRSELQKYRSGSV
ncbi:MULTISPECIES: DUF6825 family protein [Okeania]|uniref:Thylakoid lumen protein n=1 Tax=Okeania hirsuta TaxID=1458930 RepID=A0A3N6PGS4_9CYAN|nr:MULTISPECIES: hypothetical protein [Okeania]NET16058.1 hypothetical protein [Okeania sp. SIO1H6]NES77178.1 hypothetical protein [Okeania sp. SIO1H4]NES88157.1 hypothetical protein [Okeania sp. SIO2B9]NET20734.1 hypothetical protein [Okeania sp. SIO1H5]NET76978.1 hypothetical protein [Okeania sp. SIO1F9]